MEFLTIKEVISTCTAAGYKYARMEDSTGLVLIPFNRNRLNQDGILENLTKIENRYKHKITPDGIYYIRCQSNLFNKLPGEVFAVKKGNVKQETPPPPPESNPNTLPKKNEVISLDEAIKLNRENAELKMQNEFLTKENRELVQEVTQLRAEVDQLSLEEEAPVSNATTDFLSSNAPALLSILDRGLGILESRSAQPKRVRPYEVVGDDKHLAYIDRLVKMGAMEQLEKELDKILVKNPPLFQELVKHYEIEVMEEEEQEEEEEQQSEELQE